MKECLDPQIPDASNSCLANQICDKSGGADEVTSHHLEQISEEREKRRWDELSFQQKLRQ